MRRAGPLQNTTFAAPSEPAGRLMTNLLFGVKPWDPVRLTLATLLLCVAALLASVIPTSRAAGVEPMMALRNE